jgi:hypothetical protein
VEFPPLAERGGDTTKDIARVRISFTSAFSLASHYELEGHGGHRLSRSKVMTRPLSSVPESAMSEPAAPLFTIGRAPHSAACY